MTTIIDIADAVAQLLEPDPTMRDDSRAKPYKFESDMLYVWYETETFEPIGDECDQRDFTLFAQWVIESDEVGELRSRETSELVAARAETYWAAVSTQRTHTPEYEGLHVDAIDYSDPDGLDARGFTMTLTGYTIVVQEA